MKILEIYWIDAAFMLDEDELVMGEWLRDGGMHAKTIGYLIEASSKCFILCSEVFDDGTKRGFTVIPKGMVKSVRTISEPI